MQKAISLRGKLLRESPLRLRPFFSVELSVGVDPFIRFIRRQVRCENRGKPTFTLTLSRIRPRVRGRVSVSIVYRIATGGYSWIWPSQSHVIIFQANMGVADIATSVKLVAYLHICIFAYFVKLKFT